MATEDEIRKASEQFYKALTRMTNGDAGSLAEVWSKRSAVTTIHPIDGREVGWKAVGESFEKVAQLSSEGKVGLKDQFIQSSSDVAYETSAEFDRLRIASHEVNIEHRVTNIYRKKAGKWKMIHHHADISPAMVEVLSRVTAAA